jgi:hypothetical protein
MHTSTEMLVTIERNGSVQPPAAANFVIGTTSEDGRTLLHYVCFDCRALIEAQEGKRAVHECVESPSPERSLSSYR